MVINSLSLSHTLYAILTDAGEGGLIVAGNSSLMHMAELCALEIVLSTFHFPQFVVIRIRNYEN
jgi:hypothetical protein